MANLSFGEIIIILIAGILIFGPDKLPEIARNLGKFVRDIKSSFSSVTKEIDDEIDGLKQELGINAVKEEIESIKKL